MKKEFEQQIKEEWFSELTDKGGLLAKAKRNIEYWLDTDDFQEQSFKFKATELVLKLSEAEAKKVKF